MKVSIAMLTYNHERYIGQAIEGVLNQVVDFDIELVIGEDGSKDGTLAICQEYADRFPEKIKLLNTGANVGMMQNFLRVYQACDGDYVAFCEGDDYWTDPHKLQKQVDFMEANGGYSACFHNVLLRYQREGKDHQWPLHKDPLKDEHDTVDLLGPWFVPSCSILFRNYRDLHLPDWFFHCKYGDLPFMLFLSLRGPFAYLHNTMAVYRLHDQGATTRDKNYDKVIVMAYIYTSFDIYTHYRFKDAVRKAIIYEMDRHVVKGDADAAPPPAHKTFLSGLRDRYARMRKRLV